MTFQYQLIIYTFEKEPEDNIRQITVQSINKEHMVWIKIDTTETGLSLANKIHTIATFRTRKIVSITTAAGRTIPLDHRPVFGSWMDMDDFQNGEEWKVEWCELDKGLVDRLVSKFIQVREKEKERWCWSLAFWERINTPSNTCHAGQRQSSKISICTWIYIS